MRIPLHGRRVGAWVTGVDVDPPPDVALRPLAKVTGWGPQPEVLALAEWAAWRWAGRTATLLRTATAPRAVPVLPPVPHAPQAPAGPFDPLAVEGLAAGGAVLRLPPVADRFGVALAAVAHARERGGHALLVVPSVGAARHLSRRLERAGVAAALVPEGWARARAGACVVGARAAAWAPVVELGAAVVFDEHDEVYQEERTPTWHARDVVVERCRRAGAPCLLVSPMPSLEALAMGPLLVPDRSTERGGWPVLEVVDRRAEDTGRTGLYSEALVAAARRADGRVVCVLNRKGRSRLAACGRCRELARCERCEAAVRQDADGDLVCGRCGATRPVVCSACGSTQLRNLRVGVTRAREELAALLDEEVDELTAETPPGGPLAARVVVGTEAVLHRVPDAALVAFLELDQELLAPRYRAGEEALALLVRAARLVGRRGEGGRVLVQTRLPGHEVVEAALRADPARLGVVEAARRVVMGMPPEVALAEVSGPAAGAFVEALGRPEGVEVVGPADGRWLLRAERHPPLLDALAATPRPPGRLRVRVDPLRL